MKNEINRLKSDQGMSYHMDFIGQRADMVSVEDVLEGEDVDDALVFESGGVLRRVEYSTVTCSETDCDGTGFYDQRGEIVCDDCGMVLSGDRTATVMTEFGESGAVGGSRGLEKMSRDYFGHEPGI